MIRFSLSEAVKVDLDEGKKQSYHYQGGSLVRVWNYSVSPNPAYKNYFI